MSTKNTREFELDFIRVVSMLMIILCHIFCEAGVEWGEYFNAGVMIFMFMSGHLSYRTEYDKKWFANRLKRILPEYYIFVAVYLFITLGFFHANISVKQVVVNVFLLQGLFPEAGLPNVLHLWFLTYILICYALTPYSIYLLKKADGKKVIAIAVLLQIAVIPLRLLGIKIIFCRFVAYFLGLNMTMKLSDGEQFSDYYKSIVKMTIPLLAVNAVRFTMELSEIQEKLPKVIDMALGLIWQWAHMFLGILLFLCFGV